MSLTTNDLRKRQDFLVTVLTTIINAVVTKSLNAAATTPFWTPWTVPVDARTIPKTAAIALSVPVRLIPNDLEDIVEFSREFVHYTLGRGVTKPRFQALQKWFLETNTNTKEVNIVS